MRISKKILLGTSLAVFSTGLVTAASYAMNNSYLSFGAENGPVAKHYAAVMPTSTTQGIREYWTDCVGGSPVFTAPGYQTQDAVLSAAQIQAILANQEDERIIPTLDRIQAAVSKDVDGTSAYDLTFVRDAYAYNYLDDTTKGLISGADATNINAAYETFFSTFTVVYDAGKDSLPIVEQAGVSIERGFDATYGEVLEITTELGLGGKSSQLYFYGLNLNGVTYGAGDILNFSIYSPFAGQNLTSQTYWVGNYGTATKKTANPESWTAFASTGTALNSDASCATAFTQAISLQRYVNGTIDPYSGTYKMTSIVAEKELKNEGDVLLRGNNNITNINTWGASACVTDITFNVDTVYGKATQVDMISKTSVLELQWENLSVSKLANFEYARLFVYAKSTQRVYVSLSSWRNNIVNIPGVAPFADNNGTQADNVQSVANVIANQWNIIDIPVSYLSQDTDGKIFIEVWTDVNEANNGWLFTDLLGHNGDAVLDNGGLLINHSGAAVVVENDADLGVCSKATISGANGFVKQRGTSNISGFTTVEYTLKNLSSSQMQVLLYKIGAQYGNAVKGSYLTTVVAAGATQKVSVNIAEYFGSYASAASIMFRVDGAAGNSMLISSIVVK